MNLMRTSIGTFALLLFSVGALSQNQAGTTVPIFKTQTELVMVPTVVMDHKGKPIPHLNRSDFTVYEDHQPRPIAFFEEVTPSTASPAKTISGVAANYLEIDKSTAHLTIFVLDMVNTPFAGQAQARKVLLQTLDSFVDDGQPKALVLFTSSGVRVIHDFTSDPRALSQALHRLVSNAPDTTNSNDFTKDASLYQRLSDFSRPTNAEYSEFAQRIVKQSTVECFREVAEAFSGVPGRKALIWATGGLSEWSDERGMPRMESFERIWAILNEANIAVYPVDVREMGGPGFQGASKGYHPVFPQTGGMYSRGYGGYGYGVGSISEQASATMLSFARETGGKSCIGRTDLSGCFREALTESGSFYMIGYYLNHAYTKPGWHKLEVKTRLDNAKVRSRTGFKVADKAAPLDLKTQIETAVVAPLDYTAIPIATKWTGTPEEKEGKKQVSFAMLLPAGAFELDEQDNNRMDLEVMTVARQPNGQSVLLTDLAVQDHFNEKQAGKIKSDGFEYHNTLELSPGTYNIRFLIRDNVTGKIGTVTSPLKVE